jgi:hypothetical protein
MAVTYTRALQRDSQRRTIAVPDTLDSRYLLLAATSLVALLAVTLAYGGRVQRLAPAAGAPSAPVFNLSTGTDVAQLEPALEPALAAPADRRFAANALLSFIVAARQAGEELPNVATILHVTVPASQIAQTPGLVA